MDGTEDSPIPQLDGGDMVVGETIKPYAKFYFDPDEIRKMCDEEWYQIQTEKENKAEVVYDGDDMFESAKMWALSQKKRL